MYLNKNVTKITFVKSDIEMTQQGYNQSTIKFSTSCFQPSYIHVPIVPTSYTLSANAM